MPPVRSSSSSSEGAIALAGTEKTGRWSKSGNCWRAMDVDAEKQREEQAARPEQRANPGSARKARADWLSAQKEILR